MIKKVKIKIKEIKSKREVKKILNPNADFINDLRCSFIKSFDEQYNCQNSESRIYKIKNRLLKGSAGFLKFKNKKKNVCKQ